MPFNLLKNSEKIEFSIHLLLQRNTMQEIIHTDFMGFPRVLSRNY